MTLVEFMTVIEKPFNISPENLTSDKVTEWIRSSKGFILGNSKNN
jgi:hypothetical protein